MEEERARQNRAAEEATAKTSGEGPSIEGGKEAGTKDAEAAGGEDMDVDDPQLLQKALAISMQVKFILHRTYTIKMVKTHLNQSYGSVSESNLGLTCSKKATHFLSLA